MLHSDMVCRAVFRLKIIIRRRHRQPAGNHLFAVIAARAAADCGSGPKCCFGSRVAPVCSLFVCLSVKSGHFVRSGQYGVTALTQRGIECIKELLADIRTWKGGMRQFLVDQHCDPKMIERVMADEDNRSLVTAALGTE